MDHSKLGKSEQFIPCPYCGSNKLKIESTSKQRGYTGLGDIVYYVTASVRCNSCHARGPVAGGRVVKYVREEFRPDWSTTEKELRETAVRSWNERSFSESDGEWLPYDNAHRPAIEQECIVWFEYYRYGDFNCKYQTMGLMTYPHEGIINGESGWRELKILKWMPAPRHPEGDELSDET